MSFPGRAVQRTWHLVDAANQTVGRLATTIAPILKGKYKPTYRPNADIGDYVVIVNADKVRWRGCIFTTSLLFTHPTSSSHPLLHSGSNFSFYPNIIYIDTHVIFI